MPKYDPKTLEPKWQKVWADTKLYAAVTGDKTRPKYYMLTEFPYPSGAGVHAGHTREYTLGDVMARHKRMQGYNVLYPMGYDAFGLPTENYAIKHKIAPQKATADNVATFRKQFDSLGFSFDWDRQVNTTDPSYYKWTQWLFLKFFEKGLAYQHEMPINWCPKEKTGLSNEEVINGVHERCGTPVEKKLIKQWMLAITKYADRLIDGLGHVDYPPRIADQQVNWIGRKTGINVTYHVSDPTVSESVTVFTTRPDTNFGATFVVVAPEHPFAAKVASGEIKPSVGPSQAAKVAAYIQKTQAKSEIERQEEGRKKTGAFTGFSVKNELTGKDMPVWVSDFVLAGFGTGALVAVPGHDKRDFEFATQFGLEVVRVVVGPDGDKSPITQESQIQEEAGTMVNSGFLNGLDIHHATVKMMDHMVDKGYGERKVSYRLRDWIFSRQHYWGEPIPIIHCPKDGAVAVPADQLPVVLPTVKNYEPIDTGESPLAAVTAWVNTTCPTCGGPAKRETDTMPNWAGSSWYYLRYMDAKSDEAFAGREAMEYWGMADLYLGGMEHTTLHLLYSRFWHQFFYDEGLVPTPEPYAARRGQGIVLAADGRKMSKSIGNVVNPTDIIANYGADTLRLYIMFMAPYDETTPWSEERLGGASRFVYKVWNLAQDLMAVHKFSRSIQPGSGDAFETAVDRMSHKTIKKVHDDLHDMHFNTAVSALMEYVNYLGSADIKPRLLEPTSAALAWRSLNTLIQLLAPMTPHLSEELWRQLGWEGSVHISGWPEYDPDMLKEHFASIIVQVNGKVRANLIVALDATEAELTEAAKSDPKVAKFLEGQKIIKTIVVPRKVVNFVVKD